MPQISFFATKHDMEPLLDTVERGQDLRYVRKGASPDKSRQIYQQGRGLPMLGTATSDSGSTCASYMVTKNSVQLNFEEIVRYDGVRVYVLDQLRNPDTVVLIPAGIWDEDVLLNGEVSTVSDSPISKEIMKRFTAAIKKQFTKVRGFWVGPDALVLLKRGKRLTIGAHSPAEFSLTIP